MTLTRLHPLPAVPVRVHELEVVLMKIAVSVIAPLILCCLPAPLAAQAVPDSAAPAASSAGVITGTVVEAGSGAGIGDAFLTLEQTRYSTVTRQDGSFRLQRVPAGTYVLRVRRIGYQPLSQPVTVSAEAPAEVRLALASSPTRLEEMVATGNVNAQEFRSVPVASAVVTAEEIEARRPLTIDEVFQTIPGLFVNGGGQTFGGNSVSIRGASYSSGGPVSAAILVDGTWWSADINAIDPSTIERIEVFKGPQASTIYGFTHTGGVVNIITKKGGYGLGKPRLDARTAVGFQQATGGWGDGAVTTDQSLAVTGGGTGYSYRLGGSYATQGNWIPQGDQQAPTLFGSLRVNPGKFRIEASARMYSAYYSSYLRPDIARRTSDQSNARHYRNDNRTRNYNLRVVYQATPHWSHELLISGEDLASTTYTRRPDTAGVSSVSRFTIHQPFYKYTMSWDVRPKGWLSSALLLGGDLDPADFGSESWEGEGVVDDKGRFPPGSQVTSFLTPTINRAFYGQDVLGIRDRVFLTVGIRCDYLEGLWADPGLNCTERAGVAYTTRLREGVTAKFRVAAGSVPQSDVNAQRQGSQDQTSITRANPGLRPPVLSGQEFGVDLDFGRRASLSATLFWQQPKDQVEYVTLNADSAGFVIGQWQNLGEVRNVGVELEGELTLGKVSFLASFAPTRSRIAKVGPDYSGTLTTGDRVQSVPAWTGSFTTSLDLGATTAMLSGSWHGNFVTYDYVRAAEDQAAGTYDPAQDRTYYFTHQGVPRITANVSRRLSQHLLAYLSVQNLLNSSTSIGDLTEITPGRVTTLAVRILP